MGRKKKTRRLSLGGLGAKSLVNLGVNDDEAEKQEARLQRLEKQDSSTVTPRKQRRYSWPNHVGPANVTPLRISPGDRRKSLLDVYVNRTPNRTPRHTPVRSPFHILNPNAAEELERQVLDNAALSQMYSDVIKLYTQNKITKENTWKLHLIDYMDEVVIQRDNEENVNTFTKASHAIEAGAKIYACRVDSAYSETYKVLDGLSSNVPSAEGDDDGDDGTKRKRSRRSQATTVPHEKRPTINALQQVGVYAVDPMFQKMAFAFDEGGARGLLMNNLQTNEKVGIVFDTDFKLKEESQSNSDDPELDSSMSDKLSATSSKMYSQKFPSQGIRENSVLLCDTVTNFSGEISHINRALASKDDPEAVEEPQDVNRSLDFGADSDNDMGPFDFGGGDGPPNFDDAIQEENQMRMDLQDTVLESQHVPEFEEQKMEDARFGDSFLRDIDELTSSALPDLDHLRISNWTGMSQKAPKHWLFKRRRNRDPEKQKKKRKKKVITEVDVMTEMEPDDAIFENPARVANNQLSMVTQKRNKINMNSLPDDHQIKPSHFATNFHKNNSFALFNKNNDSTPDSDDDGGPAAPEDQWYNYNNPLDQGDFCPDVPLGERDTYDGDSAPFDFFDDVDLVEQPTDVRVIAVNYSKVAKRVDVSNLKKKLWSSLQTEESIAASEQKPGEDKENTDEKDVTKMEDGEKDKSSELVPLHSFQESLDALSKSLPEDKLASLSVPYCFICLLHLANEKNLELVSAGDPMDETTLSEDFNIAQAV